MPGAAEAPSVRMFLGLATVAAVFFGVLAVGMDRTGTWDAAVLGLEPLRPKDPLLRPEPWTTHRLPRHGFSLALPRGWRAVPAGAAGRRELAALRRASPRLAPLFGSELADDRAARFRAFDVAGSASARRERFVTNVVVRRSRATATPAAVWRRDLAELRSIPLLSGSVARSRVQVPGGAGMRIRYRLRIERPPRAPLLVQVSQLNVVAKGVHYVVTYTTTGKQAAAYAPVFRRSAESFRVLARS